MASTSPCQLPASVAILGSTGSVGRQALEVAAYHHIPVDLISANASLSLLEEQVRAFHPRLCAVADERAAADLRTRIADTGTRVLAGQAGILAGIEETNAPVVVNSILGEAGLMPTLAVIDAGRRLALANKESLVVAGREVMRRASEKGVEILPVDSEHCAIFQCLQAGRKNEVRRLWLTASGGPFFGYSRERLSRVTRAETLAHPTWQMGAKITVDSATLMNKGFELIEAACLFGLPAEAVTVVVQRQSIIHSMVEYIDNTVIAQLSVPDMRDCVQYALTYPARAAGLTPPLDFFSLGSLTFDRPDGETFPLLPLAARAYALGGAVPAVLNAANEEAVAAFLADRLCLTDIFDVVCETVEAYSAAAAREATLEGILAVAHEARLAARSRAAARTN
ncbi:MAG: 1-deoxy-D-xylulose-5-phosphate reductoisomerase [Clostridia bacterium]|nr:1-deoxy-D-xylulose-5-phosphate reductoisomerase [Clostridia bacterium]